MRWVRCLGLALVVGAAASVGACSGPSPFAGALALSTSEPAPEDMPATIGPSATRTDYRAAAREDFQRGDYGLAEKNYRQAFETAPGDLDALAGLAATHDMLGRYDLADRDYALLLKRGGPSVQFFNNRGYSYYLRGDLGRARRDFLAARRLEPDNEFVAANLRLLSERPAGRS